MKNVRPRSFKDKVMWKVDTVLECIVNWGQNWSMPIDKFTWKLAMLLALSSGARSSEICGLTTNSAQFHSPAEQPIFWLRRLNLFH